MGAPVQIAHNSANGSNPLTCQYGSNVGTGNLLFCMFQTRSSVLAVVDDGLRTWTQQVTDQIGFTPGNMYIYTAPVGTGGTKPTVSVTTVGGSFITMFIGELSSTDVTSSPLSTSATAHQSSTGTNVPIGPTGTSGANEFAVAVGFCDGGEVVTADGAWTAWDAEATNNLRGAIEYLAVNSATASTTFTLASSNFAGGMIAVFKNGGSTNTTITPGVLSLSLSFFTPVLKTVITPSVLSLTLGFQTPTLLPGVNLTPTPLSLTLGLQTPVLNTTITPSVLALSLSFFTPSLGASSNTNIVPDVLALSLSFFTPVLNQTITPGVLSLALSFFTPNLNTTLTPALVAFTLSFFTPVLPITATPSVLALSLTFFTPGLAQTITPSTLALVLNFNAPTINGQVSTISGLLPLLGVG